MSLYIFFNIVHIIGYLIYPEVCTPTAIPANIHLKFIDVAKNNLIVIFNLILGGFLFGSITLVNLTFNGLSIGYLISNSIQQGKTYTEITLLTLPHGIFKIPAIIIAGAAGFKIPYEIVRYLAGRKEQILTKEEYLTLSLISIVLIVIAAWIEANITLKIAKAMLNSTKGI